MLFFSPRDVLDEIWDFIESVSEGFPNYSSKCTQKTTFLPVAFFFSGNKEFLSF